MEQFLTSVITMKKNSKVCEGLGDLDNSEVEKLICEYNKIFNKDIKYNGSGYWALYNKIRYSGFEGERELRRRIECPLGEASSQRVEVHMGPGGTGKTHNTVEALGKHRIQWKKF
tara:strand:+ start:3553 stop:3897 length:345 start_codon:yes stop_codon:yes gene_type:complete